MPTAGVRLAGWVVRTLDDSDSITPGTLSTLRQRTRILMRLLSVGGISPWLRLALLGQLPVGVVGGTWLHGAKVTPVGVAPVDRIYAALHGYGKGRLA